MRPWIVTVKQGGYEYRELAINLRIRHGRVWYRCYGHRYSLEDWEFGHSYRQSIPLDQVEDLTSAYAWKIFWERWTERSYYRLRRWWYLRGKHE